MPILGVNISLFFNSVGLGIKHETYNFWPEQRPRPLFLRHIDHCQLMIGLEFQHIHTLTHYVCLGLVNPFPCSLHLLALHSLFQIVFDNTAVSGAIQVAVMAEPTVFDCNANQKNDQLC